MPIYGNQEQNSNTDNLTHPKLQLLQHAITTKSLQLHHEIFQIIKALKLFFLLLLLKIDSVALFPTPNWFRLADLST